MTSVSSADADGRSDVDDSSGKSEFLRCLLAVGDDETGDADVTLGAEEEDDDDRSTSGVSLLFWGWIMLLDVSLVPTGPLWSWRPLKLVRLVLTLIGTGVSTVSLFKGDEGDGDGDEGDKCDWSNGWIILVGPLGRCINCFTSDCIVCWNEMSPGDGDLCKIVSRDGEKNAAASHRWKAIRLG